MSRILSSIKYRKRKYFLLVLVLLINTVLNISVMSIISGTENTIREFYYDKYGEQHAAYFSLNDKAIDKISRDNGIKKGFFYTYEVMTLKDSSQKHTFGCFDEDAIELGHIKVLEGRLPETSQEIAVENITLTKRFPVGTSIGDEVAFVSEDDRETSFTIVGIVSDYRGEWNDSKYINVTPGRNSYPTVICCHRDSASKVQTNVLVKFGGVPDNGYAYISKTDLYISMTEGVSVDTFATALNENLYTWVTMRIFGFFNTFKLLIYVMILVSSAAVAFVSSFGICKGYLESIKKYNLLGASKRFVLLTMNAELSAVLLIPLALRIVAVLILGTGDMILNIADIIILVLFVNLYIYFNTADHFWKYLARYIKRLLSGKRENIKDTSNKNIERDVVRGVFGKANKRFIIPSIIILTVIITSFVISSFYSSEINEYLALENYDFMIDNPGSGMIFAHNLIYAAEIETAIGYEKILELYDMKGIKSIDALYIPSAAILIRTDDEYWDYISTDNLEDVLENTEQIQNLPEKADKTMLDIGYIIITDDMENEIKEKFSGFPFEKMKNNNSIVLLSPKIVLDEKTLVNSAYRDGDKLTFGELRYINPKNKYIAMVSPSDFVYEEFSLDIESCYDADDFLEKYVFGRSAGILIHEDTVRNLGLNLKCSNVKVWLDEKITLEDYKKVEDKFAELMKFSVNSIYYSKKDSMEQQKALKRSVYLSLLLNMCSYGIYAIISIIVIIRMNMLSRERSFGIMRSMGLAGRNISKAVKKEVCQYMVSLVLLASLLIMYIFNKKWTLPMIIQPRFMPTLIVTAIVFLLVVTVVPVLISAVVSRSVMKREITDSIRYNG